MTAPFNDTSSEPSEFGGGPGMEGKSSASDRLRNLRASGDPDDPVRDDGSTWEGLLPRRRERKQ